MFLRRRQPIILAAESCPARGTTTGDQRLSSARRAWSPKADPWVTQRRAACGKVVRSTHLVHADLSPDPTAWCGTRWRQRRSRRETPRLGTPRFVYRQVKRTAVCRTRSRPSYGYRLSLDPIDGSLPLETGDALTPITPVTISP